MQLKIYGKCTIVLFALILSVLGIGALLMFNFDSVADHKVLVLGGFILYVVACFFGFKTYEKNVDKRMIQKMVLNGQIALANIKNAKPFRVIRDTSGKNYVLWEIELEFYDKDFNAYEMTIIEKFNAMHQSVPNGTVYITHNPDKPEQKFIIQNIMISHVPALAPIVQAYEKNRKISIKYLNVYYNDGLIIETYKESIKNQKKAEKEKVKIDRQ